MDPLALIFEARLRESIKASIELGYYPHRFEDMLNTFGGVGLAKKLVTSGELQDGIRRIAALGHKELAMESIMLEQEFASLFTADELAAAQWRLDQV